MAGDTRTSKTKRRRRGVAALGVAGALSLVSDVCGACGASAATTPAGNMQNSARALLAEEEISDVSLATFYVFDKENAPRPGVQFAAGHGWWRARMRRRTWMRRTWLRGAWMRRLRLWGRRRCRGCRGGCGGCGGCCLWGWPRPRLLTAGLFDGAR